MTSAAPPDPAAFAKAAETIEVLGEGLDVLAARVLAESVVMRLRLVLAVASVASGVLARTLDGGE